MKIGLVSFSRCQAQRVPRQAQRVPRQAEEGYAPPRAAAMRSTTQRTAASPLHTYPDSPKDPGFTEPSAASACQQFL